MTDNIRKTTFAGAHPDMRRYLEESCYCPGEVYDRTGFSFLVFEPDGECVVREQTDTMTVVTATSRMCPDLPQAIIFWHDEPDEPGRIIDAQRFDATENNIGILCDVAKGATPDGRKIDEFVDGQQARDIARLLSMADMVIVD